MFVQVAILFLKPQPICICVVKLLSKLLGDYVRG